MDERKKAVNIMKLVKFLLDKIPSLTPEFDSKVRCAVDDINTAFIIAAVLREKEKLQKIFSNR